MLKIQTCVFCYGGLEPLTHACLERDTVKALTQDNADHSYQICRTIWFNDALIDRCRAHAMEGFLKTDNDVAVMIDHDIEWREGDVLRIAEKAHELGGIVGGAVAKRTRGEGIASVILQPGIFEVGADRVIEVPYVGSAFMAVPRAIVEKIAANTKPCVQGFRPMFIPRIVPNLGDPNEWDYLSEDWSFCRSATDHGFKIYLDMKPVLIHHGPYPYTVGDGFCNHDIRKNQKPPRFSLIHATRGRAKQALDVRNMWLAKASGLHPIEYLFGVDDDDPDPLPTEQPPDGTRVYKGKHNGCCAAFNLAAYQARGDVLIQVHDDVTPPDNWDVLLTEKLEGNWDREAVIRVSDGLENLNRKDGLLTVLIGTMAWFKSCGYFWCPVYTSVGCDDDMTEQAEKHGIIIEARDIVFSHRWEGPDRDVTQQRSYALKNWKTFEEAFKRRKETGFLKKPDAWGKMELDGNLEFFCTP